MPDRAEEPMGMGALAGVISAPGGKVSPGQLAELIGAFNDVTARLQATHEQLHAEVTRLTGELRQANERLERSRRLAALGEMAAGIAHEVRNPLGSIRLYARLLDEDLRDRPPERETVGKIDRAAKGLALIVDDLLTFAREFKIKREAAPAAELLAAAVEVCREDRVPGLESVRIVQRRTAEAPEGQILVDVDRGLLVRALVNVVRNAVEAMVESGSARRELELDVAVRDGDPRSCVMTIDDTGPGVPEDVIARMFNPFFTTRETGTGLGLAIVHRIVEGHGGQVSVRESALGGARIEVRLPLAAACERGSVGSDGASTIVNRAGIDRALAARGMAEAGA